MLPLHGVTVIDLTSVVAGPMATQILAQQGARVLKIEPPEGDRSRMLGTLPGPGFSAAHIALNAGKQSIGLDLHKPDGRALLERLIPQADVLVHNFRPGVMERLGWGTQALRRLRPDLVIARISGFGQEGPMSGERAYDPIIQAESGMIVRDASGMPQLAPQYLCDKISGLYAAQAISAALFARAHDGQGKVVDVSMLEAAVAFGWLDMHGSKAFVDLPLKPGNLAAIYQPWATRDGWVVVIMLSDAEFRGWVRALDAPQVLADPRFGDMAGRFANWDDLRALCAPIVAGMATHEVVERLRQAEVPCGVANRSEALMEHPQLRHDEFISVAEHPHAGRTVQLRPVARFDGDRAGAQRHAASLGQHTRAVLAEAGMTEDEICTAFGTGAAHAAFPLETRK